MASAKFRNPLNSSTQVPNIFLNHFETNTLAVVPTQSMRNSKIGCLSLCSATSNCYLACFNGVSCKISSALVTPYWKPVATLAQSLLPLTGYSCFSSWNFENDLTTKIVTTSVSSTVDANWDKSYATDGYYTDSYTNHYAAAGPFGSWFQIDMGSTYSISKVIVKIRKSIQEPCCSRFSNVEVRVGNSPTTGSFTINALLGYFNGTAVQGQFVLFELATPIVGRYISLQQLLSDYFMLAELKIIGY